MSFAQPWWWLLAPAMLGVLAWLHARRRRTLVVASLQGWETLGRWQEGTVRRSWPAWSWALLLQVLAALLAVAALAEPRWGAGAGSPSQEWVVVIGSRDVAAVWQALRQPLEGGPAPASLTLLDARGRARPLAARLSVAQLEQRFPSLLSENQAPPDWASVAGLVHSLPASSAGYRWLVLAAEEELAAASEALGAALNEANPSSTLHLLAVGEGRPPAQFRGLAVVPTAAGHELQAGLRIHADGERSWRLEVRQQDQLLAEQAFISVAPGDRRMVVPFVSADMEAGLEFRLVEASTEEVVASSHRSADGDARVPRVLLAGSSWPRLEATLEAAGAEVTVAATMPTEPSSYDLVISLGLPSAAPVGTHAVWWGALPPGAGSTVAAPLPGPWEVLVVEQDPLMPVGMVHGFQAGSVLDHPVLPGSEVLAWAEARPVVQARVMDGLAELLISFPLDEAAWSTDDTPYVLLRRLLGWIEPVVGCQVGTPCALTQQPGAAVVEPDGRRTSAGPLWTEGASAMGWTPWFLPRLPGWHVLSTTAGEARFWVDAASWPLTGAVPRPTTAEEGAASPPSTSWLGRQPMRAFALLALGLSLVAAWWPGFALRWRSMRPAVRALTAVLHLAFAATALAASTGFAWPRGWVASVLVRVAPTASSAEAPGDGSRDRWRVEFGSAGGAGQGTASLWRAADLPSALDWANALMVDRPGGRQQWSLRGAERSLALGTALQTAAEGTALSVRPLPRFTEGQQLLPLATWVLGATGLGGTSRIVVQLEAKEEQTVRASLRQNDGILAEVDTVLPAGRSVLSFDAPDTAVEAARYRLDLLGGAQLDTVSASVEALVQAPAANRVAVVADEVPWALLFSQMLQVQGLEAELLMAPSAPGTVAGWADYDAVVLFDLPAIALVSAQMEALQSWVAAQGGGLLILGGERSFGPGGYHLTVLDELSPLAAEIPMDRPDVALVFVLDRSGSMLQGVGPSNRLEIAREATWEALRLLDPRSQVGIVVFDSNTTVVHPLRPIGDLTTLREALDRLTAGGGTNLQPALEQAYQVLLPVGDVQRHMVVMTDGLTQSGDFPPVMAALVEAGITASTLAIGHGAAYPRLEQIAQQTGGVFHETVDFQLLPSIMAQEVLRLTTEPVQRGPSWANWSADGAAFKEGLSLDWPALQGFVRTTPKPAAAIHATVGDGDALLASWRYGSGRVVAWASQGVGPWSLSWLQVGDFPRLWAQLVRWTAALARPTGLDLELRQQDGELRVEVRTSGASGQPEAGWMVEAMVVGLDDGSPQEVEIAMQEVEPGLHRGAWRVGAPGIHRVEVRGGSDARTMRHAAAEIAVPAAADVAGSPDLMASLLRTVGVEPAATSEQASSGWAWSWQTTHAWRPYLLLASLLWLGCLTVRRASAQRLGLHGR